MVLSSCDMTSLLLYDLAMGISHTLGANQQKDVEPSQGTFKVIYINGGPKTIKVYVCLLRVVVNPINGWIDDHPPTTMGNLPQQLEQGTCRFGPKVCCASLVCLKSLQLS